MAIIKYMYGLYDAGATPAKDMIVVVTATQPTVQMTMTNTRLKKSDSIPFAAYFSFLQTMQSLVFSVRELKINSDTSFACSSFL